MNGIYNQLIQIGENLGRFYGTLAAVGVMTILAAAFYLYMRGKIALKMGDPFLAGIIPYVNDWAWFQRLWARPWVFWIYLGCAVFSIYTPVLGAILLVPVQMVIRTITLWKLGTAFHKNIIFKLGLIFITPLFLFILAFGRSQYNQPVLNRRPILQQRVYTTNGPRMDFIDWLWLL